MHAPSSGGATRELFLGQRTVSHGAVVSSDGGSDAAVTGETARGGGAAPPQVESSAAELWESKLHAPMCRRGDSLQACSGAQTADAAPSVADATAAW